MAGQPTGTQIEQLRTQPAHQRQRATGLPAGWRAWLLSATARAGVAIGFLLVPNVRVQLEDAAISVVCMVLAGCLAALAAGHVYVTQQPARRDLAADAVAVLALVPSAIVAASIQSADDRFGGRTENVLAALTATAMIFGIVALVARADRRAGFGEATLGALGGALSLAAVTGNTARFPTADVWQALALAWMVAASASLLFALVPRPLRTVVPLVAYAGFALLITQLPAEATANPVEAGSLPVVALVATGAIMVLIAPGKSNLA